MTSRRLRVLPMRPRDIGEKHRASTPLELLFDLSFVVAVSQAADQLSHGWKDNRAGCPNQPATFSA